MFKMFASFAAESSFQKHRLILTSKNYQAPDQYSLKKIIHTFRGQDEQTRSQIAFATIIKKIYSSDSKDNWIYLLKNLIILDKVVEQDCFLHQISQLQLPSVQNYAQKNVEAKAFKSQNILKQFWKIIKQKSKILSTTKHVLGYGRSQRSQFLSNLKQAQLYKQSVSLQFMFQIYFQFITLLQNNVEQMGSMNALNFAKAKLMRQQFYESKLIHYLHLQILYKLLAIYTSQMLCIKSFVFKFSNQKDVANFTQTQVNKWKKTINSFNTYSLKIIYYVQRHKNINGFQIVNYQELKPFQNLDIIGILDKCILSKRQERDTPIKELGPMILVSGAIQVQKKPHNDSLSIKQLILTPRKSFSNKDKKNEQNNPFNNYNNFYNNLFPPKQILTLDLIQQLRKKQGNADTSDQDEGIYNFFNRQSCIYNYRQTKINNHSQIQFITPQKMAQNEKHNKKNDIFIVKTVDLHFQNIYSHLPLQWNK